MRRGRENLFEELGRVEGEHSNKNRRAEVSRIHGELNKGYKKGGRAAFKHGKFVEAPVPHADISKYVDKKTRKEIHEPGSRVRKEGSTLKMGKKRPGRGKGTPGMKGILKMSRGGRSGYNSGGVVLKGKKVGCQIK